MKKRDFKAVHGVGSLPVRLEELISEGAERLYEISVEDLNKLMHELKLNQEELNIQLREISTLRKSLNDSQIKHEEALRLSEDKFFKAFNSSPVPMIISTLIDGRFIEVNDSFLHVCGYRRDELIGRLSSELNFWPDSNERSQIVDALRKQGKIRNTKLTFLAKSGELHKALFSAERITLDGTECLLSVANDITDFLRTEEALKEVQKFNNNLLENTPNPVVVIDPDNSIRYVNPAFEKLTGFSSKEMIGQKPPFPYWPEDKQDQYYLDYYNENIHRVEWLFRKKNGEKFWVELNSATIEENAKTKYHIVSWIDVTEHKRTEEALRESNEFNNALLENAPNSILVINPDTSVKYVNPDFVRKNGWTQDEVKCLKAPYPWWPEEARDQMIVGFKKAIEQGSGQNEVIAVKKNGERYWLAINWTSITREGNQKYLLINSIDITDRKKAEEDLKQSIDKVQRALQSSINAMAKMVEMRDPYTAGHQQKVAKLAVAIAKEMGLPEEQCKYIGMAAIVHDIGKIYVPSEILTRTGKLTDLEFQMMKTHVQGSYDILKTIEFPWPIAQIVIQHHERIDGSGYPNRLKGEEILLEARIIGLADTVEAISAHRPYRPALGMGEALEEVSKNKGILYDSQVAEACINLFLEKGFNLDKD